MEHNAELIISQANATLTTTGLAAAQNIYQSAILDWVDDVTMGDAMDKTTDGDGGDVGGEVAKLWLGYAMLNRGASLVSVIFGTNFQRRDYL